MRCYGLICNRDEKCRCLSHLQHGGPKLSHNAKKVAEYWHQRAVEAEELAERLRRKPKKVDPPAE